MTTIPTPDGQAVMLPAPFALAARASLLRRFLASLHLVTLTASEKAFELYGGATMNWALDGARRWFLGCDAVDQSTDVFCFRVFLLQNGSLTHVALPYVASGRGWMDNQPDGIMRWSAWQGAAFVPSSGPALVPGAVAWPMSGDTSALQAQIDALEVQVAVLEQTIAHLPPTTTGPTLIIPAQGGEEGGEIQLADGAGGVWAIDCRVGNLRFSHNGAVYKRWPE